MISKNIFYIQYILYLLYIWINSNFTVTALLYVVDMDNLKYTVYTVEKSMKLSSIHFTLILDAKYISD